MHYWKKRAPASWLLLLAIVLALCLGGLGVAPAHAGTSVELTELQVEPGDDGLYLSADLRLELSAAVEDALYKGIAVYFVADAEILRERWYWSDRQIASAQRYMRVAYLPLTRRWRLNTSSAPIVNSGLGVTFAQYYDTLAEVVAALQRVSRWRIASADELEQGGRQSLRFRFRLDASQLPRTFQIGAIGDADWALSIERRVDLTQEAGP
ncbi:MAG: DUF4390 domain-containing protein [Burkholderiaceae bacterium]|jgi:hypothetical protein|nr:DUF4390 domain-containing protein [Burkholderiaceae bacterium]